MKAMIFAAGKGTRLKPLTDDMPKALVPMCGKPLLAHVIEKLKAAGYREIVINVHHFADMIEDYVRENGSFGLDIEFSDERDLLRETGGGILHARRLLEPDNFIVHNVDIISDLDIASLAEALRPGALAALAVSERKSSRYLLFDEDMRLAGWMNESTGEVRSPYLEAGVPDGNGGTRPFRPEEYRRLAFSGIHAVSSGIFPLMEDYASASGPRFPIMDFYLGICGRFPVYGMLQKSLRLMDVGKIETLSEAEKLCAELLY